MFWLITGFYFLRSSDYKKLWLSTIKKIVIPGLLIILITQFLTDPIVRGIPFSESEAFSSAELKRFFISLITFRETSVYWYVFAYILVVLIQPLLFRLGAWLDGGVSREITFFVITLALLATNDICGNTLLHFSYSGIFVLMPAAIEVMWGHILFRHREFWLRPSMAVYEIILFIVLLIGHTVAYGRMLDRDLGTDLVSWYSCFGFLMATLAVILCMQIVRDEEHSFDDAIRFPAGFTYPIYLIHPFLLSFFKERGFFGMMYDWLIVIFLPGVASILSVFVGFVIFYLLSFGIAVLLRRLCRAIHY